MFSSGTTRFVVRAVTVGRRARGSRRAPPAAGPAAPAAAPAPPPSRAASGPGRPSRTRRGPRGWWATGGSLAGSGGARGRGVERAVQGQRGRACCPTRAAMPSYCWRTRPAGRARATGPRPIVSALAGDGAPTSTNILAGTRMPWLAVVRRRGEPMLSDAPSAACRPVYTALAGWRHSASSRRRGTERSPVGGRFGHQGEAFWFLLAARAATILVHWNPR